jgi:ribonucleoside-diphosphate reductase beta chain
MEKSKHLKKKKLFNPNADDSNIKVINGETTNILDLANIKYQWAHDIFDAIFANNWLPHKVSMGEDKQHWKKLTQEEQEAYEDILSFLVFLDSIQTNNLPNIADYITAPDIVYVLARQDFDEAIHSKSYGWIFNSIFTSEESKKIVYKWRENKLLLERNKFIASIYQDFVDNPTQLNFLKAIIANYLLEGLYFYNGFYFFHNLASRGLMIGTDTQIRYIQRDEIQHCNIFKNIIKEIENETGLISENEEMIYDLFKQAVEWEIKFSSDIIGDKILGMSVDSITEYANYLGNLRLKHIGLKEIFPKSKNPYKHLDMIAGIEDETSNRSNNFEVTSINYKTKDVLDGWEDL